MVGSTYYKKKKKKKKKTRKKLKKRKKEKNSRTMIHNCFFMKNDQNEWTKKKILEGKSSLSFILLEKEISSAID